MYLDGARWSGKKAALGEVRLGPAGTLGLLETRLGLTMPPVPYVRRVDQYLGRLERCEEAALWCGRSFEADPWSTAERMLGWRDQLTAGGWRGEPFGDAASPRLRALAALEKIDLPLDKGPEDRLLEVLDCLKEAGLAPVRTIRLLDRRELLPPIWRKIFRRVEELGGTVVDGSGVQRSASGTNALSYVQAALSSAAASFSPLPADDSLLLIEGEDEWEAAENLALWLAGGERAKGPSAPHCEKNKNIESEKIAIICGDGTDVLDHALRRHGLPILGVSNASRWRAASQILPLTLANAWNPVDVRRLVELLTLPMSPVPHFASRRFLKALAEEPGVGGRAWKEALSLIVKDCAEYAKDAKDAKNAKDAKDSTADSPGGAILKEARGFAEELDAMLSGARFSPDEGIPETDLKRRCRWLIERLASQMGKGHDALLADVLGQAKEIQTLADGKGKLPKTLLDRMQDSVIGAGSPSSDPSRARQAAEWDVLSHPGQLSAPVDSVIWWNFAEAPAAHPEYWSPAERGVLEKAGVELEDGAVPRRREAESWRRALRFAQKRFLMFHAKRTDGQELFLHPFWDEIRDVLDSPRLTKSCAELHVKGHWQLAGRSAALREAAPAPSALVEAVHKIPSNRVAPRTLSYSQMNTLIACPLKWAFQYHSQLRTSDTLALPTGDRMKGTLCHRIVQEIYSHSSPGRRVAPEAAAAEADRLYGELLPSMASELNLPGKELENKRTRKAVVYAVRRLAESVEKLGLTVEKSEERLDSSLGGIPFEGYADLVLRTRTGEAFVLDMKWTRTSRYKKEELEEGRALQLAAYAWLLKPFAPGKTVHAGYFMLAQGELLSDSPLLGEAALPGARSLDETWRLASEAWDREIAALNGGSAEARGVERTLNGVPDGQEPALAEPLCDFCDFAVLCGWNETEKGIPGGP
jgi:RecB family exonuclease